MSFVSSRGGATCRGTGQFLNYLHQNKPPTPGPGKLYTFGVNYYGECGVGNTNPITTLTQVGTANNWLTGGYTSGGVSTFYNIMIKSDNTMYGAGENTNYTLGLGNTTNQTSFVQIGSASNWAKASKGDSQCGAFAITTTGNLYSWGADYFGSLSQSNLSVANTTTWQTSTRVDITTPTQVANINNVTQVVQGAEFTAILKDDGTIWTCGLNQSGQLARNLPINSNNVYPSFAQESTGKTNWTYIAAGATTLLAIDNTNTLYISGSYFMNGSTRSTLTTTGLPALPTGGIISISTGDLSYTALTANYEIYYLGQNTFNGIGSATSWTSANLIASNQQTHTSYTGRLDESGRIYLISTLNPQYQLNNTITWNSFGYQGYFPNGSSTQGPVSWFIGN